MSKEEMREGFEAWHCEQYKTHGMTGAPTRDMHGGVRDENYCSKKSQALWECWQETGGDVAKVEALKEEIERIEAGQQPVAWFRPDALGCAAWKPGATLTLKDGDPLFTRSDAGEVERLREELRSQTLRADAAVGDANEAERSLRAAEQRNSNLLHTLRSALQGVKMVGLQDHLCDYALAGNIQAEIEAALFHQPTESGASDEQ